eukprot:TRINITY_DN40165_c0_g1_i1.p1 TRINITY_DN40165_c0_g1~~TRINITY_DN40165_c0_g1_i1.p1  ORF type:complete len:382 (+),score=59.92 TRINITY_DN40165_c0_g1_i1:38-1183(+)
MLRLLLGGLVLRCATCWNFGEASPPCLPRDVLLSTRLKSGHAADVFESCGVVIVPQAVPLEVVEECRLKAEALVEPYLASRQRVRDAVKVGMKLGPLGAELFEDIKHELIFESGYVWKERNEGRFDLRLPWEAPFNETAHANPVTQEALRKLLGKRAELKGIHLIYSLPAPDKQDSGEEAVGMQHLHRDTELLFEENPRNRVDPQVTPPYAINVFVPLVDFTAQNGPTEFTLGSHRWGSQVAQEKANRTFDELPIIAPAGTGVIADYRTLHRGTMNRGSAPRPMMMMIWGREWWSDHVNYGVNDYGGSMSADKHAQEDLREAIFRGEPGVRVYSEADRVERRKWLMFHEMVRMWKEGFELELPGLDVEGRISGLGPSREEL